MQLAPWAGQSAAGQNFFSLEAPSLYYPMTHLPSLPTVLMFSGQGAQYFQMGRPLFETSTSFRRSMYSMDAIVRELIGCSVVDTLYSNKHTKIDVFDRTLLTHPAIFMVEYALAQVLIEAGVRPDLTLGASLGAFAASAIAGAIGMEDALFAVVTQAITLESRCKAGGMIAVLANPSLYGEGAICDHGEIASYNFASQFVVSALHDRLNSIETFLRNQNIAFQRLPVSFAFHSRWIEDIKSPYLDFLQSLSRREANIEIACCVKPAAYRFLPVDYFWTVAREPIRFDQTILALEMKGPHRYIDVGPSGTLATFMKYLLPKNSESEIATTFSPLGGDLANIQAISLRCHKYI